MEIETAVDISKLFPTMEQIEKMTLTDLSECYNQIIDDFELTNFKHVDFKSTKTLATERLDNLIWIASLKAERNNLQKMVKDMLLLKTNAGQLTQVEKIGMLYEILISQNRKMTKEAFIACCQDFDVKDIMTVIREKNAFQDEKQQKNLEKDFKPVKKKLINFDDEKPIKAKKKVNL